MEIWDLGLSPQEFMSLAYIESVDGRTTGAEIADILGVSAATGHRVLSNLINRGLLTRQGRGRYVIVEVSPMRVELSPMRVSKVLLSTTSRNTGSLVEVPSGTSTRGALPPSEGFQEKRFPVVADDLEPGRLTPPKPKKAKGNLFNKPDKYHRLTQSRDTWTISHVVKEFEIRSLQAFPNSVYVAEGRRLSATLSIAKRDYGLTVPQMLTAIDQFFTNHAKSVPQNTPPTRYFLQYLKTYIEQQPGSKTVNLDVDQIAPSDWDAYNEGWT